MCFFSTSPQFPLLRLLPLPSTHEYGIGSRMYQFSLIPAREEPPLLLFQVPWVHPACCEPSTVKCFIQPPCSFERRLLSTLTTTEAPLLQLAVNFWVCDDIFSSDSRDFLWNCEMQSCKRTGAKYTFLTWHAARQTGAVSTAAFSSAEQVESFWRRWGLVQLIRQLILVWYLTKLGTSLC